MPTSYSTNLKISLMAFGEEENTWGDVTNTNLGTLIEQAIVSQGTVAMSDATTTITIANGASSTARCYYLNLTGALTAQRDLVVPAIDKDYIVKNSTTGGFGVRVKTSAGTGIVVANGKTQPLYVNSTNVVDLFDTITALTTIGALSVGTNLAVSGTTALTGAVTTTGSLTVGSALTAGNTTIGGALEVSGIFTGAFINLNNTTTPLFLIQGSGGGASFTLSNTQFSGSSGSGTSFSIVAASGDAGFVGDVSANSFITTSDYRAKREFGSVERATERLMALRALSYQRENDKGRSEGFLAHEVAEVAPYAVFGEKDSEKMQGIDYSKLVPLLTASLQEALQRIKVLEEKCQA